MIDRYVGETSLAEARSTMAGSAREKNVGKTLVRREGPAVA